MNEENKQTDIENEIDKIEYLFEDELKGIN